MCIWKPLTPDSLTVVDFLDPSLNGTRCDSSKLVCKDSSLHPPVSSSKELLGEVLLVSKGTVPPAVMSTASKSLSFGIRGTECVVFLSLDYVYLSKLPTHVCKMGRRQDTFYLGTTYLLCSECI